MYINFNFMTYKSVLYDCYALQQYGSILNTQSTTDIFVELPDDGPMGTETGSSHWDKPIVTSYIDLFN
jgi:hypothetical protein